MIEEIAFRCSGIHNLIVTVAEPTFEATQQMMTHPNIAVLAITGGPGIVAMGMKSGKKVIGAGAGNPPCIVDETADLVKAAEDIINGASFDYNLPCIAEKSLIVVEEIAGTLVQQMQNFGALLLNKEETDKLRDVCLPQGMANKQLVGKSPAALLQAAGIAVPLKTPRLLIALVDACDKWVTSEQLMPMLPIVKVKDFDSALTLALEVEEGLHHTAIMHSQMFRDSTWQPGPYRPQSLLRMVRHMLASVSVVKDLPHLRSLPPRVKVQPRPKRLPVPVVAC